VTDPLVGRCDRSSEPRDRMPGSWRFADDRVQTDSHRECDGRRETDARTHADADGRATTEYERCHVDPPSRA